MDAANETSTLPDGMSQQAADNLFIIVLVSCFVGVPGLMALSSMWVAYQRRRQRTFTGGRKHKLIRASDSMRARLQLFLYTKTNIGMIWDIFQAVAAFFSCIMYIVSTYNTVTCSAINPIVDLFLELIVFLFFTADYLLNLFLARDKLHFALSPVALADLLCILPTLLQFVLPFASLQMGCEQSSFFFAKFVRLIRIMRVMRMLRVVRLGSRVASTTDNVLTHIMSVATTLASVTLVSACVFQWAESDGDGSMLPFHQALYYMIVEVLGRPAIPMTTDLGYITGTIVVVIVVVIVPLQLVRLAEAIRRDSPYRRGVFAPRMGEDHIVVAGHLTFESLHDFVLDFFHEDHGELNSRTLRPTLPHLTLPPSLVLHSRSSHPRRVSLPRVLVSLACK